MSCLGRICYFHDRSLISRDVLYVLFRAHMLLAFQRDCMSVPEGCTTFCSTQRMRCVRRNARAKAIVRSAFVALVTMMFSKKNIDVEVHVRYSRLPSSVKMT
jgi:hypothetical protein